MNESTIGIIIGAIGIVISVFAFLQSRRSNKFTRNVAENQGVFKKPDLSISLFDMPDEDDFILALPLIPNLIVEMDLEYNIVNSGDASAKDVEVYIDNKSKDLRYHDNLQLTASGTAKEFKMVVDKDEEHTQSLIGSIQSLHPSQRLTIRDKITVKSPTFGKMKIPVTTKTGRTGSFELRYVFAYLFDFSIKYLDHPTIRRKIKLSIINTYPSSIKDFFDKYNSEIFDDYKRHLSENGDVESSSLSDTEYFRRFKVLVVEPDENELTRLSGAKPEKVDRKGATTFTGYLCEIGYFVPGLEVYPVGQTAESTRYIKMRTEIVRTESLRDPGLL